MKISEILWSYAFLFICYNLYGVCIENDSMIYGHQCFCEINFIKKVL